MLKICDSVLVEPLSLIYKNCIDSGVSPDIWKRSQIIPTYKKNDKRCINNYRPVSLLPICGKIFERILYNPLFLYLESNNLLTPHQSGFRPNDSCIYQLLSIVHSIYADFDHNPSLEVQGNFLDISYISVPQSKVYYTNLNLLVFQEIFLTYFTVSLMIDIKE